jgi:hypothetical protein
VRSAVNYALRQGMTPEELVAGFHHLNLAQVYALSYYDDHQKEVDRNIAENREDVVRAYESARSTATSAIP